MTPLRRTLLAVPFALPFALFACGPSQRYTDADVAKLPKLSDVM